MILQKCLFNSLGDSLVVVAAAATAVVVAIVSCDIKLHIQLIVNRRLFIFDKASSPPAWQSLTCLDDDTLCACFDTISAQCPELVAG